MKFDINKTDGLVTTLGELNTGDTFTFYKKDFATPPAEGGVGMVIALDNEESNKTSIVMLNSGEVYSLTDNFLVIEIETTLKA